jgi:hypothetical protein
VALPISFIASSTDAKAWVAPNLSACSRFHSTGSMANTLRAPAITAPCSAAVPTPPTPTIATSSPGGSSPLRVDEP